MKRRRKKGVTQEIIHPREIQQLGKLLRSKELEKYQEEIFVERPRCIVCGKEVWQFQGQKAVRCKSCRDQGLSAPAMKRAVDRFLRDSLDWMRLLPKIPTWNEVMEEIRRRRANGERGIDLAEEYGLSPSAISKIYKGVYP